MGCSENTGHLKVFLLNILKYFRKAKKLRDVDEGEVCLGDFDSFEDWQAEVELSIE